ncbi:tRNA pseudouridine(38/39) synthase-like [Lineus longissimus]|uniref:tRNA pseudouridine(38/39) synthase-like n=1 Tax=Lineus longissimus TaxID=88925 RepID=UPI002B4E312A
MNSKRDDYSNLSRENLIEKVQTLERHVKQLQNVLSRGKSEERAKKRKEARPFDFTKYNTRHVALKFLYLGWDYQGFAVQEDTEKTIEHELFDALNKTKLIESRETSNYHRCGRTDKGVSAFSQVISLDLRTNLLSGVGVKAREGGMAPERPGDKSKEINYIHILNKVLPKEIRIVAWAPVNPEFSARFSCTKRQYKYIFPRGDMNIEAMHIAAQKLVGEHDFRNFCKMDISNGVVMYTRRILAVSIDYITDGHDGYQLCELTIEGNAFLWHQIRCIVTILFLVGQGKEMPQIIDELFDITVHPRKPQYTMASELPLILFDCEYEDIKWIYDQENMKSTLVNMQRLWTAETTKATITKRMLDKLESTQVATADDGTSCVAVQSQAECIIPGNKTRIYKPLLERQTCDSLEERLDALAKRRKIQSSFPIEEKEEKVESPKTAGNVTLLKKDDDAFMLTAPGNSLISVSVDSLEDS